MIADVCPNCWNMDTVQRKASRHYSALVFTEYFCPDCFIFWTAEFELVKIKIDKRD